MNYVQFVYGLIDNFAPMEQTSRDELRKDASEWYIDQRNKVFEKGSTKVLQQGIDLKTAPLKTRIIYWGEHWAVRTALAILFIFARPMIQDWNMGKFDEETDK